MPSSSPKRGEVWAVRFDPSVGAEIRKIRPAVVISLDATGRLPLRIVVPITNWQPGFARYPWIVPLPADPTNGLVKDSAADTFQVKSISENRFVQRLGVLDPQQLDDIATSIAVCVGAP